ncbi:hypothetical protein DFJ77DRAFT_476463 [Powellomyces hirtus]|nr:hypothetical protein DFJ77DRAFT_476463 [Powellomyces hirtus]
MQATLGRPSGAEAVMPDTMTRQELRIRLFETLRTRGVADKLKSQLRAKIVAELKLRVHGRGGVTDDIWKDGSVAPNNTNHPARGRLLHQVLDSLVVGYLRSRRMEFTLSVFLPESGCADGIRVLAEDDVMQALHLDHRTPFYRALRSLMGESHNEALLVNLVTSLTRVADLGMLEAGCQTEMDMDDLIEHRVRETDKHLGERSNEQGRLHAMALEERMLRYQREVEARLQREMEGRFTEFRSVELAQMRIEERTRHEREVEHLKTDYAKKIDELRESAVRAAEAERVRLTEREKLMEQHNLDLRQRLLEENNRAVMKEATLRTEAELVAQQNRLERDAVQRRFEEAAAQLDQLRNLKEKYSEKLQEAMAMYKIDTNKEYQALVSRVEIEKAKLEAERTLLRDRIAAADAVHSKLQSTTEDVDRAKAALADANAKIMALTAEKVALERIVQDLKNKALAVKTSATLEFEIHNLREQLTEAEKMAEKRQEDYQSLLKSFMVPDTQKELAKARRAEATWQRECQQLVLKLDVEINRNEELRRKCEEKILLVKQQKRENADLKLVLHQTREALNSQMAHNVGSASAGNSNNAIDYLNLLDQPRHTTRSDSNIIPDPYRIDDTTNDINRFGGATSSSGYNKDNSKNIYRTLSTGRLLPDVQEAIADSPVRGRPWDPHQQHHQPQQRHLGPASSPHLDPPSRVRIEAGAFGLPLLEERAETAPQERVIKDTTYRSGGTLSGLTARSPPPTSILQHQRQMSIVRSERPVVPPSPRPGSTTPVPASSHMSAAHEEQTIKEDEDAEVMARQRMADRPALRYADHDNAEMVNLEREQLEQERRARTEANDKAAAQQQQEHQQQQEEREKREREATAAAAAEKEEAERLRELQAQQQQNLQQQQQRDVEEKERKQQEEKAEAVRQRRLARQMELEELDLKEKQQQQQLSSAARKESPSPPPSSSPPTEHHPQQHPPQPEAAAADADKVIDALEHDPEMQKYIEIVKARKAAAATTTRGSPPTTTTAQPPPDPDAPANTSIAGQVRALMSKLDASSFLSSRSSVSDIDLAAGDTADQVSAVSAPTFEDTTEDEGW